MVSLKWLGKEYQKILMNIKIILIFFNNIQKMSQMGRRVPDIGKLIFPCPSPRGV